MEKELKLAVWVAVVGILAICTVVAVLSAAPGAPPRLENDTNFHRAP